MRSAWVRALHESRKMRRACVLLKKTAKKRLLRHTQQGSQPYRPRAALARAAVPPCPGAAAPAQLGRLPEDLRLPFIVVSAWLDNLRRHEFPG